MDLTREEVALPPWCLLDVLCGQCEWEGCQERRRHGYEESRSIVDPLRIALGETTVLMIYAEILSGLNEREGRFDKGLVRGPVERFLAEKEEEPVNQIDVATRRRMKTAKLVLRLLDTYDDGPHTIRS